MPPLSRQPDATLKSSPSQPVRSSTKRYELLELCPAPAETFALFRKAGEPQDKSPTWREPVIALGRWREITIHFEGDREVKRVDEGVSAGPLVLSDYGTLQPAEEHDSFVGVRTGSFSTEQPHGGMGFDDPAEATERPAKSAG